MRTFVPKNLKSKPLILKSDAYSEEEIKFSNKKTTLSGTITVPKKDDKCAAVLLLGGFEESDREEQGLFTHVADMLGKNGYLALRFDRRGIGSSQGSSGSSTYSEGLDDAKSALDYLLARKEADPQRVFIIAHGSGALYAAKIASDMKNLKGLVLMSPVATLAGQTSLNFDNLNEMAAKRKWDDLYLKLAIKSRMETIDRVKNSKNNWTYILGTRCFLKKIKEAFEENPTDIIRKVECPVLILHGKEDDLIPSKDVAGLDKALEESQNKDHKLIYYGYLGHFFGKQINDGEHKLYYNTDPAVLETIIKWLDAITKIDLT
jgi:alpha-beta hydrolase superfamily lysophospholipase